jgi:hypothetical protein
MSSQGNRRSSSSKPTLSSSSASQPHEGVSPAAEPALEPVRPAQETMDQSSESMVPPPSSLPSDPNPPTHSASPEASPTSESHVAPSDKSAAAIPPHSQPIPPASEPMQYRAIGLLRAKYVPSEKQFTRGQLVTEDDCTFNAVLLGRVMSLVKKHLDPEAHHLWVVYPRTREKTCDLHVQIVGVWEPETLDRNLAGEDQDEDSAEAIASETAGEIASGATGTTDGDDALTPTAHSPEESAQPAKPLMPPPPKPPMSTPAPSSTSYHALATPSEPEDGYFSIRGEIVNVSQDPDRVTVKIQQSPRKGETEGKSFRLVLAGELEGRLVGHFWEMNVRRQGLDLVIEDGQRICVVPPRKPVKGAKPLGRSPSKGPQRRSGTPRPTPRPHLASAPGDVESTDEKPVVKEVSKPSEKSAEPVEPSAASKPLTPKPSEESTKETSPEAVETPVAEASAAEVSVPQPEVPESRTPASESEAVVESGAESESEASAASEATSESISEVPAEAPLTEASSSQSLETESEAQDAPAPSSDAASKAPESKERGKKKK